MSSSFSVSSPIIATKKTPAGMADMTEYQGCPISTRWYVSQPSAAQMHAATTTLDQAIFRRDVRRSTPDNSATSVVMWLVSQR